MPIRKARQEDYLSPRLARRIRHTARAQAGIARLAGVTRGQVWKVVNLHRRATPEIRMAIRRFFELLRSANTES